MRCIDFQLLQIAADEYHARAELSSGAVKCFSADGPWEFFHRYILRTLPNKDSEAKRFGSAFHAYMENPETFKDRFATEPVWITVPGGEREPVNKRLKKHREFLAEWTTQQELAGRIVLQHRKSGDDKIPPEEAILYMAESVAENPAAAEYLAASNAQEIAAIAKEETTGLEVKALADLYVPEWHDGGSTVVDFKTTEAGTPEEWARKALDSMYGLRYDCQAAWYTDIFHAERFVFVVVRSKPPWECWVRVVNPSLLRRGRQQNDTSLKQIAERMQMNDWHNNGWGAEYPLVDEEKR